MSQTTDALLNLSAALKDAITLIRQKLADQASTDQAQLAQANAQIDDLKSKLSDALQKLAEAPSDGDTAAAVTAATNDFTAQLKDLASVAQASTPPATPTPPVEAPAETPTTATT